MDAAKIHQEISRREVDNPYSRAEILKLCKNLINELEDPTLRGWDWMGAYVINTALCILADLNIFEILKGRPKTAKELAKASGADALLITRIVRWIESTGAIKILGHEIYQSTPMSDFFSLPLVSAGIKHQFDMGFRACAKLPEFLRRTKYANPEDGDDCPFQEYFGTTRPWFDWMNDQPREGGNFNAFMTGYRSARKPWSELVPVEEIIYNDLSQDSQVCVVDVGGGYGHDLALMKKGFRRLPQRLVLQDRQDIINSIPSASKMGIEATVHDFWTTQPVKDARAYVLKSVLHDWPEAKGVEILNQIAGAMKPGYSKVIILENVLPDGTIPMGTAGLDALLMCNLAAGERTESQWRGLLDAAGMTVRSVHRREDGDGLIEAVLK